MSGRVALVTGGGSLRLPLPLAFAVTAFWCCFNRDIQSRCSLPDKAPIPQLAADRFPDSRKMITNWPF
jgi:hypothetical protein